MNNMAVEVLLIEDNPEDAELTIRVLKKNNLANNLVHLQDGEEALDYLYHRGKYADPASSPRPGIILLDLNMPRKDGREALAEIKRDVKLRRIPVIILTTSKAIEDVSRSYDLGASGFITKPVSYEGLVDAARILRKYWFEVAELPSTRNGT